MTIERPFRWRNCALALGIALPAWFVGVLTVTVLFEPTSSVVVVGPLSAAQAVSMAEEGAIIDVRPGYVRVASLQKGFVRSLYAHGAWLVWPMIDAGCAGLPA